MKSLPTILPSIDLNDYRSECEYDTWFISVIAAFLLHHRIRIKSIILELGYDDDDEITKWYTFQKAQDFDLAEQDYMRVTIKLHTNMPADTWESSKQKIFQELLLRCRDNQWPYRHYDWNGGDEVSWDYWSEDENSCEHYSILRVDRDTISLTWMPCWCS